MKSFLFAAFLFTQLASAQIATTEIKKVCDISNPAVCAELEFLTEISSSTPGEFMIQIRTQDEVAVSNFKASLWMSMGDHGHGSKPLKITAMENTNQFKATNAYFVMMGSWLVRLDFEVGTQAYHLEIPVEVETK